MLKAIRGAFTRLSKRKEVKKIRLGICAMDKKAKSKPMQEILRRFPTELFDIVFFGDECILRQPIEEWPVVEVLIAFYSSHFPTEKALEYVKLVKPYMINDLEYESVLKDRRKVYDTLQSQGIDVPKHVYCNRENGEEPVVEEFDEYIVVNGVQINKPLVEKPVDAEDHNIFIYYPMSAGGGSKRLYRKIEDRSSTFYPKENELRRVGSYIYEEFVVTQGTDVKVYTVGLDYGHAEARKSPVVDGRVIRDTAGLEVRYPVILSPTEKEMARKIVTAFKQTVCGFDILRVQGRSYCCDVNGFSFVKKSAKYYDDASQVLVEIMINKCRPDLHLMPSTRAPLTRSVAREDESIGTGLVNPKPVRAQSKGYGALFDKVEGARTPAVDDGKSSPGLSIDNDYFENQETQEELRCVIAVVRHGDRTPKQKMKVKVTEKRYLDYFHHYAKNPKKDVKVKSKVALMRFLEVTREIVADTGPGRNKDLIRQLKQIKDVLERWEISGINRKLQMKPQKWENDQDREDNGSSSPTNADASSALAAEASTTLPVQATEILLILKWGGDLTPLGRRQAEELGKGFRTAMYPGVEGGGMLRLHSTYRHDLKIKASDEGRVMKTAAAFAKGLLELEGHHLTPILASLVTVEEVDRQMLDREGNTEIKEEMDRCKDKLKLLQSDQVITEELVQKIAPNCSPAISKAMLSLGNPKQTLQRMHSLIGGLCDQLNVLCKKEEEAEDEMQVALLQVANDRANQESGDVVAQSAVTSNESTVLTRTPSFSVRVPNSSDETLAAISNSTSEQQGTGSQTTVSTGPGWNDNSPSYDTVAGVVNPPQDTPRVTPQFQSSSAKSVTLAVGITFTSPSPVQSPNRDVPTVDSPELLRLNDPSTINPSAPDATGSPSLPPTPLTIGVTNAPSTGLPPKPFPPIRAESSCSVGPPAIITPSVYVEDDIDGNILADINKARKKKANSSTDSLSRQDSSTIPGTPLGFSLPDPGARSTLYLGETLQLMTDRWEKLYKDFYSAKQGMYDLSKVPDVYDSIRYEVLHNRFLPLEGMEELFDLATKFENAVVPQEYGATADDKRFIGSMMCNSLLHKIKHDLVVSSSNNSGDIRYMLDSSHASHLEINSIDRAVRTRLYFTSESHLYTLLNVLRYSAEGEPKAFCEGGLRRLDEVSELSYLTQIVFRLFEDKADPTKFRCEIQFSPGAIYDHENPDSSDVSPYIVLNKSIPCDVLLQCLDLAISAGDAPTSNAPTPSSQLDACGTTPNLAGGVQPAVFADSRSDQSGDAVIGGNGDSNFSELSSSPSKSLHRVASRKVTANETTVISDSIWAST